MTEIRQDSYSVALNRLRTFSARNVQNPQEGNKDILRRLFLDVVVQGAKNFPEVEEAAKEDTRVSLLKGFTIHEKDLANGRYYIKCDDGHIFYIGAKPGAFLEQLMDANGATLKEKDFQQNPLIVADPTVPNSSRKLYFDLQGYSYRVNRAFRTEGIIALNDSIVQHKRGIDGYWYAAKLPSKEK